jgi:hypothetical protein
MTGRPTTAFLLAVSAALLSRPAAVSETNRLVREAVSTNAELAGSARARLREMGPSGLKLLFEENLEAIEAMREGLAGNAPARPEWERLRAALDAVARQRDAAWSSLYWYTDLSAAKAAAARGARPILSLRLLGNLDEELSCANSRFFRTVLYANAAISNELRDNWILHWESVRPAPKITIDFGDGRKLERTITGNSLHYVLSANGELVDVLPGLWGPKDFLREIEDARKRSTTGDFLEGNRADRQGLAAARSAVAHIPFEEKSANGELRREIVRPHETDHSGARSSVLDASSLQLMRVKMRGADVNAFVRTVRNFEQSLAADTAVNLSLRRTIRGWLSRPGGPVDLAALTNRIYDDLFLTPRTDPWLGLVAADAYSAIEGDPGAAVPAAKSPAALRAGGLAVSKMIAERPALTALAPPKR